jgi:hypothetical protein
VDDTDRLARVRQYVKNNRDVWTEENPNPMSRADQLAVAYADIYQKVLNVIDTGDPMRAGESGEPKETER